MVIPRGSYPTRFSGYYFSTKQMRSINTKDNVYAIWVVPKLGSLFESPNNKAPI